MDHVADEWTDPEGVAATGGARLSRDDRRRQLIRIGLELLATRPIQEVSIDEVAAQAGISRSLLFHYFPSKRDYYADVVRAASRRLLRVVDQAGEGVPPEDRLRATVDGFVTFIERRRDPYVALVRGAAGGDAWVTEIYEATRTALVDRAITTLDADPTPALRAVVRGWLAFCEELILDWTRTPTYPRAALITLLTEALPTLTPLAPLTPPDAEGATRP